MSTIHKIVVTHEKWTNINDETDIPVGTPITIQNESPIWVHLTESKEDLSGDIDPNTPFRKLTSLTNPFAFATITRGSDAIWARSSIKRSLCGISVQIL